MGLKGEREEGSEEEKGKGKIKREGGRSALLGKRVHDSPCSQDNLSVLFCFPNCRVISNVII